MRYDHDVSVSVVFLYVSVYILFVSVEHTLTSGLL